LRRGGDDLLFLIFGLNPVDFLDGRHAPPAGSRAHSKPDPDSRAHPKPNPGSQSYAKFAISG
jgi:hypothetical protein